MNYKYVVLVLSTFLYYSCSSNIEIPSDRNPNIIAENTDYSYLALGDSYTIGTGVSTIENYPSQLINRLISWSFTNKKMDIIATNGWTTANLLNAINSEDSLNTKYDIVTLLIGVNNQYQNKPIEIFESEFNELLERAISIADNNAENVIVLSIPDYSVTPFVTASYKPSVSKAIDDYNTLKREISLSKQVTFIDITTISRLAANDESLLASDNLHPSAKMYNLWVDVLINEFVEKLQLN